MTQATDFPMFIDSSMLASITQCETQAYWRYIRNRAPLGASIHLVAGAAYAKGLEIARRAFYEGGLSSKDAIAEGLRALWIEYGDPQDIYDYMNHQKSPLRMAGALEYYFDQYPMETDILQPAIVGDRRMIEFSFTLELPGLIHPNTGEPLLYCGRTDMISEYNGCLMVEDDKTTGYMGPTWLKQWELRSQFMGYTWAAKSYGLPVAGAVTRGVAIRKTGYDTAQAINYFPDWQIERWLHHTTRKLQHFIDAYKNGDYLQAFGNACTDFGGCEYTRLCTVQDPEPWLDGYYHEVHWNPLARPSPMEVEK